jgi:hypothetical protein
VREEVANEDPPCELVEDPRPHAGPELLPAAEVLDETTIVRLAHTLYATLGPYRYRSYYLVRAKRSTTTGQVGFVHPDPGANVRRAVAHAVGQVASIQMPAGLAGSAAFG